MTALAWLARASHAVVLSYGWRRAAIAFAAGAISVLALAPVNAWPVLFVTFPVLVLVLGYLQSWAEAAVRMSF